jgi:dipeptidyl aminopeptidase/acylaminoacyl peptidase
VQLTTDGGPQIVYGLNERWSGIWSPDSQHLVLLRSDERMVRKRPSVDWLSPEMDVEWVPYYPATTGATQSLFVWDAGSTGLRLIDMDLAGVDAHWTTLIGWVPDGSELLVAKQYPGQKRVEVVGLDPVAGDVRPVFTEVGDVPMEADALDLTFLGDGFLWASERDGMRRLYRFDIQGNVIGPITPESVRAGWVEGVDRDSGWIYFMAHANPERPYDEHLCRVRSDGTEFEVLTPEPGGHEISLSPNFEAFVDVHSSVIRPWRTDLKGADGTLIRTLAETNLDRLQDEFGWVDAEEFVVKAADGETELWGVITKPFDFDPSKSYPVYLYVYTGIWAGYAPYFGAGGHAMAQLGFVSVTTSLRGEGGARDRAFRTAFYGRRGCCEHDDAAAVLQQLAAERPYMDMTRVGVMGGSQGGYSSARFILMRPDVFKVAVSERAHMAPQDNLIPFMGTREDNPDGWAQASNIPLADRLEGKLLLIQPSDDHFFHSTMEMVQALIRAGKDFDMLIVPGAGHVYRRAGEWGRIADDYVWRWKMPAYLVEHLQPGGW